jgi:hypothetical protein
MQDKDEDHVFISLETNPTPSTYQILSKCWANFLVKHEGFRSHEEPYHSSYCRRSLTLN